MKYFLDTNIFLRVFIIEDEASHLDCKNLLSLIRKRKINGVTSGFVLAECIWVMQKCYKIDKKDVVRCVKSIINTPGLNIIDGCDYELGLNLYEKKSVKFIDTLIATIINSRHEDFTLVSYDKDFDKLGILRKMPAEVPGVL